VLFELDRDDFKGIVSQTTIYSLNGIHEFVNSFHFFSNFDEVKVQAFCKLLKMKKIYKNEVLYNFGDRGENMYIMKEGQVERQITIDFAKENKWPVGKRLWQLSKIVKTFQVELAISAGEMFGMKDMMFCLNRVEKVVAVEDAVLYYLGRSEFLSIFNERDIFIFLKKIEDNEKRKAGQISNIIENKEKECKKKGKIIRDAVDMAMDGTRSYLRQTKENKLKEWINTAKQRVKVVNAGKKMLDIKKIEKNVNSVYEK